MSGFSLGAVTTIRSEFMNSRYYVRIESTAIRAQSVILAYTSVSVVASVNEPNVHYQSHWWDID